MEHEKPALTKIIATLGPSTDSLDVIRRLVASGVSIFRLNFSHGEMDEHRRRLHLVREAAAELQCVLAVLGDLPGPKLRVGKVPGDGIELHSGQDVLLRTTLAEAHDWAIPELPCSYPRLAHEVRAGHRVLINDGAIRMLAVEAVPDAGELRCRVTAGGCVTSGKGVNLPDSDITAPAITPRDRECVRWAVEHQVDFLALSFVRHPRDVRELRALLSVHSRERSAGAGPAAPVDLSRDTSLIPIIAKIEKPQGVERIDDIVDEADGIMVARGDLGVELDVAHVPIVQKHLIHCAARHGKPCIVATQMLESMIERATPTRAEASDVANAIFDGAHAVMLSGETAVGRHPVLTVETMRRIALATEDEVRSRPAFSAPPQRLREERELLAALAHGAWHMCHDVAASLVVVWSQEGEAARRLSLNRFNVPIFAFSSDETAVRRMVLLRGVTPVYWRDVPSHRSEFAAMVDRYVLEHKLVERGERMIMIAGKPFGAPSIVNTVSIRIAGEFWTGAKA